MKVGDLVKENRPFRPERTGMIIEEIPRHTFRNQVFKVLWHDGTTANNIWDYDLRTVNESR